MNFQDAAELFATARNPERGKPLCNNTRLFKRGDNYAIQLHDTDVVTLRPDGAIVLDSGNWQTVTTKDRINNYSSARLHQTKGQWYVEHGVDPNQPEINKPWGKYPNYLVYLFQDGMVLMPDGKVLDSDGKTLKVFNPAEAKRIEKYREKVKKYARDFIDRLYDGEVSVPSSGDCLYCGVREVGTNKPLGELSRTPATRKLSTSAADCSNHVESHIKERHFVPSLLVNAVYWRGSQVMKWTVSALMRGEEPPAGMGEFVRKQLVDCLRAYCFRELGMPYA